MFIMDTVLLILSSASCGIAARINSEDFVFPLEKSEDFSVCTFRNGSNGRCVSVSQCPNVRIEYHSGINPTLCNFENNQPVVCCRTETEYPPLEPKSTSTSQPFNKEGTTLRPLFEWSDQFVVIGPSRFPNFTNPPVKDPTTFVPSEHIKKKRKSAASCEDVYSLPVPFNNPGQFHITIVGGQVTALGEFPHMAALGRTYDNKNVHWICGGTLISHDYVLTAAHCVVGGIPPDVIRVGESDLLNADEPQDFGVEVIIKHPEYLQSQLYNDIALIKLNRSATITTKVRPACLWQGNSINFTDVTATGYGHTEFGGKPSNELLKVDLKIFNNAECSDGYKNERLLKIGIIESQLCAGDSTGEKDTCQGDSGGPIQVSTKNENQIVYHVVGVTSFGKACATTLPGVYTRVSHYLDWIENIVWA